MTQAKVACLVVVLVCTGGLRCIAKPFGENQQDFHRHEQQQQPQEQAATAPGLEQVGDPRAGRYGSERLEQQHEQQQEQLLHLGQQQQEAGASYPAGGSAHPGYTEVAYGTGYRAAVHEAFTASGGAPAAEHQDSDLGQQLSSPPPQQERPGQSLHASSNDGPGSAPAGSTATDPGVTTQDQQQPVLVEQQHHTQQQEQQDEAQQHGEQQQQRHSWTERLAAMLEQVKEGIMQASAATNDNSNNNPQGATGTPDAVGTQGDAGAGSASGAPAEAAAATQQGAADAQAGGSGAAAAAAATPEAVGGAGETSSQQEPQQQQQAAAAATAGTELAPLPVSPLGKLTVEDVKKRLKAAQSQLLGSRRSPRPLAAGLAALRELHALVEAALPGGRSAVTRELLQPLQQPAAAAEAAAGGAASQAVAEAAAAPVAIPTQRPLSVEVALNRENGLSAAASATFLLAALQSSGVLPPSLLHPPTSTPAAAGNTDPGNPPPASPLQLLHQAARGGSLEALMALAETHAQGLEVVGAGVGGGLGGGVVRLPPSCPRALQFAKLAAQHLNAEVDKEQRFAAPLAPVSLRDRHAFGGYVAAEEAENGADVVSMEEDMALRGNPEAQRRMAYRRLVGRGLEADPEGAFHDFQAAAAQGDPYAAFNVGYMHLRGLHVPQNHSEARRWFEKAAEKQLPAAYNGLGVLAWNGQGMEPNVTLAREHFERGAALNNSDSLYNLATMHYHGVGTPQNQTLAVELFQRAHEQGHWRAPYMLALAHETGAGLPGGPDCGTALRHLRGFFADRTTWGQQLTAAVKRLDEGDPWGALLSYLVLAEQGSAVGAANAGWLLRRRAGYAGRDAEVLAAKYFQRAAKQNHTASMIELAHLILQNAPVQQQQQQGLLQQPQQQQQQVVSQQPEAAAADGKPADAAPATPTASTGTTTTADGDTTDAANAAAVSEAATVATSASEAAAASAAETTGEADAAAAGDAASAQETQPAPTNSSSSTTPAKPSSSSRRREPPPPLVPPAPLPSGRVVLGVSGAAEAAAWYRAAAAADDPEGLFYLGWVTYRGVGVPENATLARLLWLRSFDLAGIRSPRALAPLLALAGMRLDAWLTPLAGRHALARAHGRLLGVHEA
ncbi:hypothetical protein Agub_g422, partial [Astrephomene gubernaculifera]